MVTSAVRGIFKKDPRSRNEVMSLIHNRSQLEYKVQERKIMDKNVALNVAGVIFVLVALLHLFG